jgi:hypothetical protein
MCSAHLHHPALGVFVAPQEVGLAAATQQLSLLRQRLQVT